MDRTGALSTCENGSNIGIDSEFELPEFSAENLPTLESILQEKESDVYNFEDLNVLHSGEGENGNENDCDDGTRSIISEVLPPASYVSITDLLKPKKTRSVHGSVLRHVILRKMSCQMNDACERRDAGLPTCMAVSTLIVIGTSRGISLVFEAKDQILKVILGTKEDGDKHGAVTALGINCDCTRLLCGYARGHITMWDLTNGNCLRVITEAHPVGFAVLHIQFTDDPTVAMLNDSSGSVYTLSFKRRLTRTCESSCFFSGAKGEVCVMAPLHVSPNLKKIHSCNTSLLAMASLTKLIVVDMSDKPVAVFTQKMTGPQDCLPLLCWYFTLLEAKGSNKVIVPVLAFARNQTILLYRVEKVEEQCIFQCYRTHVLDYTLIAMAWLNSQVIVTVDTYERIRTVDVSSGEVLECLDLSTVQLVYGSSYFKSLSTGGNVSNALHLASEYACYQSVQFFNGQLLFLGTKSIHCLTMRSWKDRLDYFVRRNAFVEALELAKLFYLDKGKAVVGLTGSKKVKRSLVAMEIVDMLLSYLDLSLLVNCPKTNDENVLRPYFKNLVQVSIEYSLLIEDLDILFTDVYDRFTDNIVAKQEFLQGLEYFILEDKLVSLSPVLMQDLIEHFEVCGRVQSLQACIVHLNLSTIDIDHMVRLCWEHRLYDLIIYVYNKGLNDYITPLQSLLKLLVTHKSDSGKINDDNLILGQKLLVYLSCCLAGHQYPMGTISDDKVDDVKTSVFNFLFSKQYNNNEPGGTNYPNINSLLMFDTRELLNVLSIAFEESEFETLQVECRYMSKRQQVVDTLLEVMLNSDAYTPAQIGCLFTFIARQMAKYGDDVIRVNETLFEELLTYLTNPDADNRHEERQQALLELHSSGILNYFDEAKLLQLAESAKFYRVCEILYNKGKEYYKVFSCYWRDVSRSSQVFRYIDEIVSDEESCTDVEKERILTALLEGMDNLVEINSMKFARLIINHFPAAFNNVAHKLQNNPEIQYAFLKGVFHMKSQGKSEKAKFDINPVFHERFIELMCSYEAESVCNYLQCNDTYRLKEVLDIVQAKQMIEASAYLYERMGDVHNAFKILCDHLNVNVTAVNHLFLQRDVNESEISEEIKDSLKTCRKSLQAVMQLCQRNSSRLESEDREALWFPLLETMMKPQRNIKNTTSYHFLVFKELTKDVLMNMMEFISLPAVLHRIMQDPTYSSGKFSDIKELIFGMIDTYNYELTLLETTRNLLGMDLLGQYRQEKKILTRGFQPNTPHCYLCSRNLDADWLRGTQEVILFRCRHVYHRNCLQSSIGFDEELVCVQCDQSSRIRVTSYTRSVSKDKRGKSIRRRGKGSRGESAGGEQYHHGNYLSELQETYLDKLWNVENNLAEQKHLFGDNSMRGFLVHR